MVACPQQTGQESELRSSPDRGRAANINCTHLTRFQHVCVQISQGCAEIRWLATRMGAKQQTIAGLSGFADVMLTCYGALSRNRQVGMRLGQGESIHAILESSTQVAEGVTTAGSVVNLARKFRVQLPVLTAVAAVLADDCDLEEALRAVINLPQLEER